MTDEMEPISKTINAIVMIFALIIAAMFISTVIHFRQEWAAQVAVLDVDACIRIKTLVPVKQGPNGQYNLTDDVVYTTIVKPTESPERKEIKIYTGTCTIMSKKK